MMYRTHHGLDIYALILRKFYKKDFVLELIGKQCETVRNPFNKDSKSLKIKLRKGVFMHTDYKFKGFKGNALDFANLYYQLDRDSLLKQINKELCLNLDKQHHKITANKGDQLGEQSDQCSDQQNLLTGNVYTSMPKFTFFKSPISNTVPYKDITILDAYNLIRGEYCNSITNALRQMADKAKAKKFKASRFDYACFSGTFCKRGEKHLKQHSGLMVIDFDHLQDAERVKRTLLADNMLETELLFRSPSGDGLKWVINTTVPVVPHGIYFEGLQRYLQTTYELEVDQSGKDVARACFLPYDPEVYINPKYLNNGK
ncbi:BT4734/BF3469 family protein [Marinifilum caeruleilacunae]|uniref:VirE protein n=1 Tax=Marinifilum caeruleilacunae TaxID=2499076 RepID=A0ABX1X2H7_9BACT|nr:BT4734/BF3469 family protein [Marinifilum caeruleilacunae]NOU62288.1 VirE protein [Marinifilum caeruleilacunae]